MKPLIDPLDLKEFEIFSDLSGRELDILCRVGSLMDVKKGEKVFEEKTMAIHLYLLLSGQVEITISGEDGIFYVVDTVNPGEVFGWSSVIEPYTFTAGARAVKESDLIVFDGETLRNFFEKNPRMGLRMMMRLSSVISRRLRKIRETLVSALSNL